MPRLGKTILPKVRKSLQTRGVAATIWRCVLGPYTLLRQHLKTRKRFSHFQGNNQFDLEHGVETTQRVHLTDLEIDSPNWIYADGYWPTPPPVFEDALSGLNRNFENLIFIDFGSGKGRALLVASEFPFRKPTACHRGTKHSTLSEFDAKVPGCHFGLRGLYPVPHPFGSFVCVPLQPRVPGNHFRLGSQYCTVIAGPSPRDVGTLRDPVL
jgi:hypothetical protein